MDIKVVVMGAGFGLMLCASMHAADEGLGSPAFQSYMAHTVYKEGNPDKDPNKTLGAFLETPDTYSSKHVKGRFDNNLRRHIAACIAPKSSHECPIDFLTRATVIPEEWGTVHDIMADSQGNLKVLTCSFLGHTRHTNPWVTACCLGGGLVSAVCLRMGYLILTREELLPLSVRCCGAIGLCMGIAGIAFLGTLENESELVAKLIGRWEIRVYDVKRKAIETQHRILSEVDPKVYFLHDVDTIEISYRGGTPITLRKNEPTNSFTKINTPADPVSLAKRIKNNDSGPESDWESIPMVRAHNRPAAVVRSLVGSSVLHKKGDRGTYFMDRCLELREPTVLQLRCTDNMGMCLEKMGLTDDGYTITQSLLLPEWIRNSNIHAPAQSNCRYVLLTISRENLLIGNRINPKDVTQVIVDVGIDSRRRLSPALEMYLERIIKDRSTTDMTSSKGFSLKLLGNEKAWREKLYKLCKVDEVQMDQERRLLWEPNEQLMLTREAVRKRYKRLEWWAKVACGGLLGCVMFPRALWEH